MAEWNLRYEKDFKTPLKEQNYFLKTINDFTEISAKEQNVLNKIIKYRKVSLNG